MDVCESGHDEIVYNSRKCPCCELLDDLKKIYKELNELKTEHQDLEYKLDDVTDERDNYRAYLEEHNPEGLI